MKFLLRLSISLSLLMIIPYSLNLDAQSASGNAKKQTYRKARVLQSSTAKKIQKVVEALERVDDEGKEDPDTLGAKAILTELLNNKDSLKSYDRSVMWNYWGYIYFSEENYDRAMNAYEQIIQEPEVTLPLRNSALFTLAQLYMVKGNFEKGIQILLEWMTQVDSVTAQAHSLLATAYFQVEDYINARDSMLEAVRLAEEVEEYRPKEQWYVLLTACYSQLADKKVITKAQALNKNLDIFEILVNYYPKKIYFLQLAGAYGQLNRELDQLVVYKSAYMKDLLDKENEYTALAQLLLLNKNPYWAAKVLVDGQNKMVLVKDEETEKEELKPVVKDSFKTLKLLADAWRMAQEIDKAIPVLEKAASMAKNGETYILLGNLYLFEDRLEDAIKAIENGIKKGGLKRESQAHLVLGQAFFELEKFEDAKKYFRMAARDKDKTIKKTANSWIKYSENEAIRVQNLQLRREFIEQNS
jgi:tetratricopeptide (TPR) repeat protein